MEIPETKRFIPKAFELGTTLSKPNRSMLSGEGNKNDEKATIGLINKNATLHVHRTSFVLFFRCFARLQRETSGNFLQSQ